MQNAIIIVILVLILIPAVSASVKHLKGEGDCCGGPKEKPRKKKISGKPIRKVTLRISGMKCNNCRVRVENRLNEFDGLVAKVSLADASASLKLYKEVDLDQVLSAVDELGYEGKIQ